MKKIIIVLTFICLNAWGSCENIQWISNPRLTNNQFIGHLKQKCMINKANGDLESFHHFLRQTIGNDVVTRHSGPVSGRIQSIAVEVYDQTLRVSDGLIRQLMSFGKRENELVYRLRSVDINFNGFAGYLAQLEVDFKVTQISSNDFEVELINKVVVNKPSAAPGGIFLNMSTRNTRNQFNQSMRNLIRDLNQNL
jgi:hypothetical protein